MWLFLFGVGRNIHVHWLHQSDQHVFPRQPSTVPRSAFDYTNNTTVYYLPGTTGWSTNYGGAPTALWTLPYPVLLSGSLGVQTNGFGFTVSWATNASVLVEASKDLSSPVWQPVQTNALNNGVVNFTDPEWTKYPSRFYRVRSQ